MKDQSKVIYKLYTNVYNLFVYNLYIKVLGGNEMSLKYNLGDMIEMKKQHPCGSKIWKVTRVGVDIKIKCQGCDHVVMIPRIKFEKRLKKVQS